MIEGKTTAEQKINIYHPTEVHVHDRVYFV